MTTPVAKATTEENGAGGSRLARALTRLAEPGQGLPSVVDGGAEAILDVLLKEIDETVMPRRISLLQGADLLIRLVVSNRRLVSTRLPDCPNFVAPVDPRAAAQLWAGQLNTVLSDVRSARFVFERSSEHEVTDAVGCSATMLAKAAGIKPPTPEAPRNLSDFFAVIEGFAIAWIFMPTKGSGDKRGGDAALVVRLAEFAARNRSATKPRLGAAQPECVILPLAGGINFLSASLGDEELFAFVSSSRVGQAINAWQKRF
ncbi:hypothetical protein [Heliomarina baculiformis]|uniref:hypothetical protein n=1 Tax=Heliomarina baculiformis TaxID=2872036 RepID=UPI001EE16CBC|nr:hypothetical protein [Heliomarina baculiformis]